MSDTNLVYPYEFEGGKKAVASEVNANFEAIKTFANGINVNIAEINAAIADLKNKPTREMFDVFYSFSSVAPAGAYPLWTGETITHCKSLYPAFWNKIKNLSATGNLSVLSSEDEYEEKLETYGECASFYMDELNGHLRLPKITKFISSISDLVELAKEENAGLPNITGSLRPYRMDVPDGSFYQEENPDFYHRAAKTGSTSYAQYTTFFDASKSNEIYGKSDTVQPSCVKLCLYIQVANNIGEISEFDTKALAKELENSLISLETSYKGYVDKLHSMYDKIKDDILNSSPTIKDDEIEVLPSLFEQDNVYKEYPYSAKISLNEATEDLVPCVNFKIEDALGGNYAPVAESKDGYIIIYAKEIPTEPLVISSIILQ